MRISINTSGNRPQRIDGNKLILQEFVFYEISTEVQIQTIHHDPSLYNISLYKKATQLASLKASMKRPYVKPILKLFKRARGNVTFGLL